MGQTTGLFITSFITFFTIYSLASLSGLLSERSGVVNIGIDGSMIMGALTFVSMLQVNPFMEFFGGFAPFVAVLIAVIATMLYSTLFSIVTINYMGDQVIAGTAINMIAPAFSLIIMKSIFETNTLTFSNLSQGWLGTIDTFAFTMMIISFLIIGVIWVILSKTKWGLRLKSAGENPYALETSGVSVLKTRWISITLAGALSGIAGALFPIALGTSAFGGTVNGSGFIALAILLVGQWKVLGIILTSLAFSILTSTANMWTNFDINFPSELINIIPFIIPIIVMIIVKSSSGPESVGKPFKKDMR